MEHEEHVLNLSDVVHDETIDDSDSMHSNTSQPHHDHTHAHDSRSSSSFDPNISSLHDSYPEQPSHPSEAFSVEMLEREIASLLNQNASAASAALLSAAAQQRQANLDMNSTGSQDHGGEGVGENIATLGLNLSGLAAVLHAAHAQAAENERVAEELAAKDPEFARQREAALAEKEQKTTRTAPAFHSLTAGESSGSSQSRRTKGDGRGNSKGSDYLFTDGDSDSDTENLVGIGSERRHATPPSSRTRTGPSRDSSPVPGEFSDINDILTQFSAQFDAPSHDPGLSSPDPSPVVSHSQTIQSNAQITTELPPLPVLAPSNRPGATQPVASTSTIALAANNFRKKAKKVQDNHRSPHVHPCEEDQCQKTFTRKSDLARHMRIHTGERPFLCEHDGCGKSFIQRSALQVHSRVHTGEKPHCCEYPGCGKTFGDSSSLARHRRTHTGKRPYKCEDPTCEKTFTRRTTLTSHMRTHDPNWEPDPNVKYDFKGKKRKISEADEEQSLAESVRTISALFQAGSNAILPSSRNGLPPDASLDVRVASIGAEIAAAIAQAQSRVYEVDEEEDDEDEESGSGQELGGSEIIGPNTSGIRDLGNEAAAGVDKGRILVEEDDDSDAFPMPLRTRKGKDSPTVGNKRKR